MVETLEKSEVGARSLAPKNPLPYWRQVKAVRSYIDGLQTLVDAGGPITRIVLGPKWLLPNVVLIASPKVPVICWASPTRSSTGAGPGPWSRCTR